jgi:hypothetical protein
MTNLLYVPGFIWIKSTRMDLFVIYNNMSIFAIYNNMSIFATICVEKKLENLCKYIKNYSAARRE